MSGTLFLPNDQRWSSSGWIYDNVLERMATILVSKNNPTVADKLLGARTEVNGGYLDFREADTDILRLLLHTATEAYNQFKSEGASSFYMPEFYPGFMCQFDELLATLHALARTDR